MFVNLIKGEFLKLKSSFTLLISLIGSLGIPALLFLSLTLYTEKITFTDVLQQSNVYMTLVFGVLLFGVILFHIFNNEYVDHTLKSIMTTSVSKTELLLSKYITLLLLSLILTMIIWLGTIFVGYLGGATGLTRTLLIDSFIHFMISDVLIVLSLTPFIFLTLWLKNIIPTILLGIMVTLINLMGYGHSIVGYFPYAASYLLPAGEIGLKSTIYHYSPIYSILIIMLVCIGGYFVSWLYFTKTDIQL